MSLRNNQESSSSSSSACFTQTKITRAIEEQLNVGHKSALLLRDCLLHADSIISMDDDMQAAAGPRIIPELLENIISSFQSSIAKLDYSQDQHRKSEEEEEVSAKWEDDSRCFKQRPSQRKGRRGCYKRRKGCQSWTKLVPALVDDGQAWRKYGQKAILNSPFPRSYFRCAHKLNKGCLATKQVQQSQLDPPLYTITYDGYHTCTHNFLKSPSLFVDSKADPAAAGGGAADPSVFLSFSDPADQHVLMGPSPFFGSPPPPSSSDYVLSPEFAGTFNHHQGMASNASSNCCSGDFQGMEFMNHEVGVTDFDDFMKLEEFDYSEKLYSTDH